MEQPTLPTAAAAPQIETHATAVPDDRPNPNVAKVIVAVHGVGDQQSFATLQAVVNQFCAYYEKPAAVPLGQFHQQGQPPYCQLGDTYPDPPFPTLAFAEVYWAKIPRDLVSEQHTLEEAKQWARTIVERYRLRWRQHGADPHFEEADFVRIKDLLTEMIQTLAVLERLCYLAERAGVFSFDLRKLLDDYLGDVQVVTEFGDKRADIVGTFHQTMRRVRAAYPQAHIYVVAHSEGTVVSLLGLLEALGQPQPADDWIYRVRGLMTIGSPIDKHLLLWPQLFPTPAGQPVAWLAPHRIEWRNYYDRGDPIGFSLNDARSWLKRENLTHVFQFDDDHDHGFTRYPFPGKAHVDYWQDEAVFGHFIHTVVNEGRDERRASYATPPGDLRWTKWPSYVLPYVGVLAVLFVAVYVLFKVLSQGSPSDGVIFTHVLSLTLLTLGVTVATRIPRITRAWGWRVGGGLLFGGLAAACLWLLPVESASEGMIRAWLGGHLGLELPVGVVRPLVAAAVVVLTFGLSVLRPTWGLGPLLVLGTVAIFLFAAHHAYQAPKSTIWPVFPATVAFLYLWWLAALLFDLVFVWHVQIRQEQAMISLDKMLKSKARSPRKTPQPADAQVPAETAAT